ncbi:MAG: clostripain-related cysteine peptidase, partial [bacterium]|nr:clostripain-related cysteine peptidase [bacterium]
MKNFMLRGRNKKGRGGYYLFLNLLFLGVFYLSTVMAFADENQPNLAPINPAFKEYMDRVQVGKAPLLLTTDGYGLGLIPAPLDMSHLKGLSIISGSPRVSYPTSYDLRTLGQVTPVKDQGGCGSCWTFATYGSLESWMLGEDPGDTRDFSENNLKECHGFNSGGCEGGNQWMSTAYLTRWGGPINETDDPYQASDVSCNSGLTARKHIESVLLAPDRTGPLDNDNIKQTVMDYGAMYTSMYYDGNYYNSSNYTYYYNGGTSSNHAVAIVGWDDNKVVTGGTSSPTPSGNGAWIVRNSWSPGWGDGGYFYVSYYDTKIGSSNASFINAVEPGSTIYQYDPLGNIGNAGYSNDTAWGSNIFTATANEYLTSVGTYAATVNTTFDIYIYDTFSAGSFSGLLGSKTVTLTYPGYHTIHLDTPIQLTNGDDFSVVIKFTTPGYNYPIPYENPVPGYSSAATASSGQSYTSPNGSAWTDITSWTAISNSNVCIKGIAHPAPTADAGADDSICSGSCATLNGQASGGTPSYTYSWSPATGLDYSDSPTPSACPDTTTTYTLTVTDANGCTAADQVVITVNMVIANAGADDSICSGSCTTLNGQASGGTPSYTYSWSPATGLDYSDSPTPNACPDTTTTYTLTVEDDNGCTGTDQVTVTVNIVIADAGDDDTICSGCCTTLNGSATGGSSPYTYFWSPATGLDHPDSPTPNACPDTTTIYTLTVTDNNGCTAQDQVLVTVTVEASWTFLVYLDGDNNLEDAGIDDLNEMEIPVSSGRVNVVVQFDRIAGYNFSNGNWTTTRRYLVTQDGNPGVINSVLLEDMGELNMGDPATLVDFVEWGMDNYPANHYALILWNHGGGWRERMEEILKAQSKKGSDRAVCWDDTDGGDCLFMSEVKDALVQVALERQPLDLLGFDACLMNMIEVAYQVRDHAGIMVGSEEVEPGDGWPYDPILGDLNANPAMSPAELGTVIVDRYGESYPGDPWVTQSAIDLTTIPNLTTLVSDLADSLVSPYWDEIRTARQQSESFAIFQNIDLYHFVDLLGEFPDPGPGPDDLRALCAQVKAQLASTILANYSHPDRPNSHGLAIYFPETELEFDPEYACSIIDFPCDTLWDEFLAWYRTILTASAGADVSVCTGTCTTLNGSASGGTSPYTYSWSPVTGLDHPDSPTPNACPTTTTTYTLTVTDSNGCTDQAQVVVTVNSSIVAADFSGLPTAGSAPLTVDFSDLSSGDVLSWLWDFGDGNTSTAQNPLHIYTDSGTYTVSLTVSDTCGSDSETRTDYITVTDTTATVLSVSPATKTVGLGNTFILDINLTNAPEFDSLGAYLSFDTNTLEVTNLAQGPFPPGAAPLTSSYDNQTGQTNYAIGLFSGLAQGSGTVLTITFKANAKGTSPINFDFIPPRNTEILNGIAPVPFTTAPGEVTVVEHGSLDGYVVFDLPRVNDHLGIEVAIEGTVLETTTDSDGYFLIENILPATYQVTACVPGASPGCWETVSISAGTKTTLDTLTLLNADANGDCMVSLMDFGYLKLAFLKTCDDPGWEDSDCYTREDYINSDFNGDGMVSLMDFGFLKLNFLQTTTCPCITPLVAASSLAATKVPPLSVRNSLATQAMGQTTTLRLSPRGNEVNVGDIFTLDIDLANVPEFDSLGAYLSFDANTLEV